MAGSTGSGSIIVAGGYSVGIVPVSSVEILTKFGVKSVQEKVADMSEPRMFAAAAILGQCQTQVSSTLQSTLL